LAQAKRVRPRRRWQRVAGSIGTIAAAAVAAVGFAVWGVPGF
jgi:hypothetical protein